MLAVQESGRKFGRAGSWFRDSDSDLVLDSAFAIGSGVPEAEVVVEGVFGSVFEPDGGGDEDCTRGGYLLTVRETGYITKWDGFFGCVRNAEAEGCWWTMRRERLVGRVR